MASCLFSDPLSKDKCKIMPALSSVPVKCCRVTAPASSARCPMQYQAHRCSILLLEDWQQLRNLTELEFATDSTATGLAPAHELHVPIAVRLHIQGWEFKGGSGLDLGYKLSLKKAELPTCFACSATSDLSWFLFSSLQIRGEMTKPRNPMMKDSPQGDHCISVNMIVSVESACKAVYIEC